MHYNLKATDLELTPEMREYLEKKLASLDKFVSNPGTERMDVELQFMRGEAGGAYRAEYMFHEPSLKNPLRAEARGGALHEVIDLAEAEIFREMSKEKHKKQTLLRRGALRVKEYMKGLRRFGKRG